MESLSQQESILDCQISQQDSMLECQICFNYYSLWRRPKLLDCQHTCCSVCLTQMRMSQSELRCPWCRSVTTLPPGVSVSQLLDDPDTMAIISVPYTPVFIRLPCNAYLPVEHHERATGMEEEHGMREWEEGSCKSAFGTRFCLVVVVVFVLLLLVYIILHSMTCNSERFTMISCG
ncbi:E3 ubiquitin-protein ligase RNF152 [Salmo salar]|uniref:RING-type E3 ubiquitin transferase n=1 Tax=Salmo salar TaxID=8030 RepID=A0A1S3R0Y2_SALSA|nr:E3 ubiquitin-protein ligase RNF152 [Salmo salar]XP_014046024.1 E3 ubiquitin-protein ligase RNF152 [Salmo salar]XP_014046025.1 E3 ubiquitin-protein ligase RNF152 [Salmo salar]XP_045570633.1 E3 ubiquitin-protein ligase RNF152 [Salmo salar]XP_045570634.1 E3 ubiquitin-protein ligase RNF152 [Salmo salar]XP_045570635.1 E3 ubiquitin-protein ligase RNF152 [Salmo salar]|eukprot:XP_014046020.1 PREDICTED: E3 ubiquitin-protein ligase RNF152-like [Salmo salar]